MGVEPIRDDSFETGVALIVKERGAYWPLWVADMQKDAAHCVVEAQGDQEAAADFALRVARRSRDLKARPIRTAVFLCSEGASPPVADSRCWVARAVLGALGGEGHGELVLAGSPDWGAASRTELFGLAGILCEEIYGRDVSVRVRFSSSGDSSGPQPIVEGPEEKLVIAG